MTTLEGEHIGTVFLKRNWEEVARSWERKKFKELNWVSQSDVQRQSGHIYKALNVDLIAGYTRDFINFFQGSCPLFNCGSVKD